jgi:phosphoglycolate phosphatase-like HAD superfamily hydrolase
MRRLVLWDVDGTLIDSAKLGRDAFLDAFEAVTGSPAERLVPFAGRTDLEIAHDLIAAAGIEPRLGLIDAFERELERAMAERAGLLRERGRALPGAREAIARLEREPGVLQSLLTGNIEPNARVKLGALGLDGGLDFEIGAYGSDHRMRGELVAIARRKAERKHDVRLGAAHVVLVGDTPLDVAAAREGGARAVGVATGPYDEGALDEAGADAVLADLTDLEAFVRAVLDG